MASSNAGPITGKERIRIIQGGWDTWIDRAQFTSLLALSTLPNVGPRPYTTPTTILGTETISTWQDGAKITMNAGDITTYLAGSGTAPPHPDPNLATTFTGNELIMGHQSGFRVAWSIAEIAAIRAASDIFAGYSLAMPFKGGGTYRSDGTTAGSASGLPGYTFARSGGKSRYGSDGTLYTAAANQPLITNDGYWVESAFTNLLLNAGQASTLATQGVTVTAQPYTLSFYGTGTVTLSGVSTAGPVVGTGAGIRSTLTFTPTAGSLTLTVTGGVIFAGLVAGSLPGPVIATGGSATTVSADDMRLSQPIPADEDWVLFATATFDHPATLNSELFLCVDDGTSTNRLIIYRGATSGALFGQSLIAGTSMLLSSGAALPGSGRAVLAMRRKSGEMTCAAKVGANAVVIGAPITVGIPSGLTTLSIGGERATGNLQANAMIEFVGFKRGTLSDADLSALMAAA